jgi:hypothetical protein
MIPPWRVGLYCSLGCLAAGGYLGWRLKPDPPPEVHYQLAVARKVQISEHTVTVEGPERVITQRVEVPGPAGPTVTVTTVVERGPTRTETGHQEARTEQAVQALTLVPPPPAPLPRWSLGGGILLSKAGLQPGGGVGVRLIGPIWISVFAYPTVPALAADASIKF